MTTFTSILLGEFRAAGIQAAADGDGDIIFMRNGFSHTLCFDSDDLNFSCLMLPNVWQVSNGPDRRHALEAINDINGRIKLVKSVLKDGKISFVIELWLPEQIQWRTCILRAQQTLEHALHLFADAMQRGAVERKTIVESASGKIKTGLDRDGQRE